MSKVKPKVMVPPILERPETETETRPGPIPSADAVVFQPWTWLTVEALLIALLAGLALTLRLWTLDHYPLSDSEAVQSLVAGRLYEGQLNQTGNYSPLLVSLTWLAFVLFSPTDAAARLVPALCGVVLVVLPLTLRSRLGPAVCLLTAALLAFSPTALFLSRSANSEILVATGGLMVVAGFFNWADSGRQRWLYLLAGGAASMLAAGPLAYSLLIIFGLMVGVQVRRFSRMGQHGLALANATTPNPPPLATDGANAAAAEPARLSPSLRRAGIFLGVTLVLLTTAFTFNLSGFGVATGLSSDWLSRFSLEPRSDAGFNAIFLLTIYEPLLVIAGLIGLTLAILSYDLLKLSLVGWFMGAVVLDLAMFGRPASSLILSVTPLAFLAAIALAELLAALRQHGAWANEGLILVTGLVIAAFGYMALTGWLVRVCTEEDTFCYYAWLQSVAAASLFLVVVAFFWFVHNDPAIALRGLAVTGAVIGLIAAISISTRLSFGPLEVLAYQPLAGLPPSTETLDLVETLTSESSFRVGDQNLLNVTLVGSTPSLLWQLRNFERLSQVGTLTESDVGSAVITLAPNDENFNLGESYIGQGFALNMVWSPVGLPPKELLRWLIYRSANPPPQRATMAVLWLPY